MGKDHKNDEIIKELYRKFDLKPDDVFTKEVGGHVHYRIITRRGIDKIEAKSNAKLEWRYTYQSDFKTSLEIWARKYDENGVITDEFHTNGEADRDNVKMKPAYIDAMALARGKSRAILGIEGFYAQGFMSVDLCLLMRLTSSRNLSIRGSQCLLLQAGLLQDRWI
jgi:hypothetical protein